MAYADNGQDDAINEKRAMTSAISDLTVAEVRTALKEMRSRWNDQCTLNIPLDPTTPLYKNYTMGEFALLFVLGHHQKRHHKSTRGRRITTPPAEQENG